MAEIFNDVKKIVVEQLGVEEGQVEISSSFVDDLGADSLDLVELIMALEEKFNLQISEEEAQKLDTVEKAVSYLEDKTKTK